jgi:hypothetical protein
LHSLLKVVIKQDGKVVQPVNDVYELKKSPFLFEINSTNLEGFLIGATTDENIYAAAADLQSGGCMVSEYRYGRRACNKDKELFLMDTAPSYWYYTDAKDHRFDKNPKGNLKQWTATRTITRFYDIMVDQPISLKDFNGNAYVLMYEPVYNDEYDLIGRKIYFVLR